MSYSHKCVKILVCIIINFNVCLSMQIVYQQLYKKKDDIIYILQTIRNDVNIINIKIHLIMNNVA